MRIVFALILLFCAPHAFAQNSDVNIGYYYPDVTSQETFDRILVPMPPVDKEVRVGFTTTLTNAQLKAPDNPDYVVFAKGQNAEKLIIVALNDDIFRTLYRARAVMAQLTSNMRGTEFFAEQNLQVAGTFFDLLQMMHFKTLVITDGVSWAHRVSFIR